MTEATETRTSDSRPTGGFSARYQPSDVEHRRYGQWVSAGYLTADPASWYAELNFTATATLAVAGGITVDLDRRGTIDVAAEHSRLEKDRAEADLARIAAALSALPST